MGLLDPLWNVVDETIAGAGGAVGGAIGSVGDGITQTGRSVGDSIANAAQGYAGYVNDTANYVRDATGASGVRKGTAVNPLGLTQDKAAAWSYGAPSLWKSSGAQKQIKSGPPNAAAQKKTAVGTAAKSARGGATSAAGRARATPKSTASTAKKPVNQTPSKSAPVAPKTTGTVSRGGGQTGRAGKSTRGTVTGRKEASQMANKGVTGQAKKPSGTVTGGTVKRPAQIKK